jgi:hypothetical protein
MKKLFAFALLGMVSWVLVSTPAQGAIISSQASQSIAKHHKHHKKHKKHKK